MIYDTETSYREWLNNIRAAQHENGMLPEQQGRQQEFVEALIAAGIECGELPKCNPEYYTSLNNWLNTLIEYNHLER